MLHISLTLIVVRFNGYFDVVEGRFQDTIKPRYEKISNVTDDNIAAGR
jgi:hypothetical protein